MAPTWAGLTKFYQILWCQIAPVGLANWAKKVFPRNIPYRERPKGPSFNFFRHCETFFGKISPKGPPSIFLVFCVRMDVGKSQRVPFQFFFDTVRFFSENKNFSPLQFLMFCDRMDVEKPQRVPLSVFRHCETFFFENLFFSPKGPPFNCDKNVDNFGSVPLLARQGFALAIPGAPLGPFFAFSIFEYCKLTLGSPFAIFEPWIWRRLGPVPACYFSSSSGIWLNLFQVTKYVLHC